MIKAAVMGYGTIGSGVCEVLDVNREQIARAVGDEIEVKYILDVRDFTGTDIEDKVIHDISLILDDPEIRLVVETMGGLDPAYPYVKALLLAGKNVATSNKALVAAYGTELLEIARRNHVNFQFEASVGGGIPIIRNLYKCLMDEKIMRITGILNGTTNYILTRMDKDGSTFDEALKEAQDFGYAERDPSADVEGYDTCRKLAILTAMVSGREVDYNDVHTEGITGITDVDFRYADKMNMSIKLVGSSFIEDGKATAWVAPFMIGKDNPLYSVQGVYNGIMIESNMLGTSMFYGSGAGRLPTASAVVADLTEEARHLNDNIPIGWNNERLMIEPMDECISRFYARISGSADDAAAVEQIFGNCQIFSLGLPDEFAVLTAPVSEKKFREDIAPLSRNVLATIRAEVQVL